ncbi:hypothetical protein JCM8202_002268 [Rhodotorula sphaerocarpa]
MPFAPSMGAKTWRAPGLQAPVKAVVKSASPFAQKSWFNQLKIAHRQTSDDLKRKKEEAALAKAFDKEASKLTRKRIKEAGRLIVEEQKDEYLARLKADVARLEAKQADFRSAGGKGKANAGVQAHTLEEKLRTFRVSEAPSLPGGIKTFDPIDNGRAVHLPDLAFLDDSDLPAAQALLDEAAHALEDELVLFAIEEYEANALLGFRIEGPVPVQDDELRMQGFTYELVASGIPAILRDGHHAAAPAPKAPATMLPKKPATRHRTGFPSHAAHVNVAESPLFGHVPFEGGQAPFPRQEAPFRPQPAQPFPYAGGPQPPRHPLHPAPHAPTPEPGHPSVPPELANLPWATQMYVKRMRALQEQEERERRAAAARTGATATGAGNFGGGGGGLAGAAGRAAAAAGGGIGRGYLSPHTAPAVHPTAGVHPATVPAAQQTSVDPDHGGLGLAEGKGMLGPTAGAAPPQSGAFGPASAGPLFPAPHAAQASTAAAGAGPHVLPSRENGWRGAQPW